MDSDHLASLIPSLMLGASEAVEILATTGIGFVKIYPVEDIALLADGRLRLRCMLADPDSMDDHPLLWEWGYSESFKRLEGLGWEVRRTTSPPKMNLLIVDREVAVVTGPMDSGPYGGISHLVVRDPVAVKEVQQHFEFLWSNAREIQPLYEDLLASSTPELSGRIVVASNEWWSEIFRELLMAPKNLFSIEPRKFEELVAELLIREGMDVHLTQASRDGGRDILAFTETAVGRHLYLVECKRYAAKRPVDVGWIRALYGVVEQERATAGLIVTTSYFTPDAVKFSNTVKHRISLRDQEELIEWIRKAQAV